MKQDWDEHKGLTDLEEHSTGNWCVFTLKMPLFEAF